MNEESNLPGSRFAAATRLAVPTLQEPLIKVRSGFEHACVRARASSSSRAMQVLLTSDIAVVTLESGFVRVRRTSRPLVWKDGAIVGLEEFGRQFRLLVPLRERKDLGILLDMRDGPMAMNDESQVHLRPFLVDMMQQFRRAAVLMQTALGVLQAARRTREETAFDRRVVQVFNGEAAAIAHLRGEEPAESTGRPPRRR